MREMNIESEHKQMNTIVANNLVTFFLSFNMSIRVRKINHKPTILGNTK